MSFSTATTTFVASPTLAIGSTFTGSSHLRRLRPQLRISQSCNIVRSVTSVPQSPLRSNGQETWPRNRTTSQLSYADGSRAATADPATKPTTTAPRESDTESSPGGPEPGGQPPAPLWPRLLILFVAAVFGTNFPVVKFLQSGADPVPASVAALARFSLASAALMPAALSEMRSRPLPRGLFTSSAVIGVATFIGYFTQALSLQFTDAGKSAFLCSLAVVCVPLIHRIVPSLSVPGESTSPSSPLATWGAPFLAVVGIAFLELTDASPPNIGDFWGLVQAAGFGVGFILNERAAKRFPGYSLSISALQLAITAVFSGVWGIIDASLSAHAFTIPAASEAFSSAANSLGLLYVGLVSTALTVVLSNISLSRVTAGELTVLLSTEPIWAAVFAAAALGEHMGSGAAIGAVLILGACLVNQADVLPFKRLGKLPLRKVLTAPLARLNSFASYVQDLVQRSLPPT